MENIKHVDQIIAPPSPHFVGDGFRVSNFIPSIISMKNADPFIMLDYNAPYEFAPSTSPKGVGVHPHKGFETVTIAYQGEVEHGDSMGNHGIIKEGDVQWMTAAKGILHKEHHETEWSKKGGVFQMVQLWVNLPAQYKNHPARYQNLENKNIPKFHLAQEMGVLEVIAGDYENVQGAAQTFSPLYVYNITWKAGATLLFKLPESFTTLLLMAEGEARINGESMLPANHVAYMKKKGDQFSVEAITNGKLLLLSGEPLNEPIAAHGPFVMNTPEEISQAFADFHSGKFGTLQD